MKKNTILLVTLFLLTACTRTQINSTNKPTVQIQETATNTSISTNTATPVKTATPTKEITSFGNDPMNQRIEDMANQYMEYAPVPRGVMYDIAFPVDAEEFEKMEGFAVLRVVALSQNKIELPLTEIYITVDEETKPLTMIADWESTVPKAYLSNEVFGPYRWDGFYLLPIYYYMHGSSLKVDFAKNRDGFEVSDLSDPFPLADFDLEITKPTENNSPDPMIIFQFIAREYPGTLIH